MSAATRPPLGPAPACGSTQALLSTSPAPLPGAKRGTNGKPRAASQAAPQALARGRRGGLMVSCQELCEAEGQGRPDEEEVGEEETRRRAHYGRLPGEGVCVKEQPLRGPEPKQQRRPWGPGAVCSHTGPARKHRDFVLP